ncbi:MAG: glycosyltransferase family 2 protein [Gammaproteobacteria bacterium]|jgi:glycosyltransferase involved in cell wall biosynthesis|nr:glycosyltransferase family 2 protein [Gammaproteobacteria bacterium]
MSSPRTKQLPLKDITVGISFFNKEKYIYDLREQICELIELGSSVILINDGSTTIRHTEIEKIFSEVEKESLKLEFQMNSGSAATRNRIIDRAQTQYLVFLDADDALAIDALKECSQLLRQFQPDLLKTEILNPESELISSSIIDVQSPTIGRITDFELFRNMGYSRYIYKTDFVRKNKLRFLPSFMELGDYFILDDVFWMIQIQECEGEIMITPQWFSFYKYFQEPFSVVSRARYRQQERLMPKATRLYLQNLRRTGRRKLSERETRNLLSNLANSIDDLTPRSQIFTIPDLVWALVVLLRYTHVYQRLEVLGFGAGQIRKHLAQLTNTTIFHGLKINKI